MGNRSKDATLFALQERAKRWGGDVWLDVAVKQRRHQLPLPGPGQRIKCIRNRWGKWRG